MVVNQMNRDFIFLLTQYKNKQYKIGLGNRSKISKLVSFYNNNNNNIIISHTACRILSTNLSRIKLNQMSFNSVEHETRL